MMTINILSRTLLIVTLLTLSVACNPFAAETPTPTPPPLDVTEQPPVVSAEAFVQPIREAELSFEASGRVVELLVEEGYTVSEGDVLARIDDSSLQSSLQEAEANLKRSIADVERAEAELVRAQAGPTAQEIAQSEAQLAKTEAALAELLAGPTAEEIAETEAAVRTAQAQLNQVLAGSRDEDIQQAAAAVMRTETDVREAQRVYDRVRLADADVIANAGTTLQKATLSYEEAQANYQKLINGSTDEEIAISRAQVVQQEMALARVMAGQTAERIAQAQADVAAAQASLSNLLAGAKAEDIAVAEANVVIAEASVETAEIQIAKLETDLVKYELVAPFDGQIGALSIEVGEIAQAGQMAIVLGDTTQWQIETDDLTEIDIVQVKTGQSVTISVDALPDDTYQGRVLRIRPRSETKAGDVTYTVLIDITSGDLSRLFWGMTTFVDINVE